jgi:Tfp pilus assembly PilM family ATPase
LPGLADYLSSVWGIPVELANPFARVEVSNAHVDTVATLGPHLAVAVGLGLRHAGDKNS